MLSPSLKIFDIEEAASRVSYWKESGETIVFTNGLFDILHIDHINFLEEAAAQGTKLIIGINSDVSALLQEAEKRPLNKAHSRVYLMASLSFVDAVVAFDKKTPIQLIERLIPNILVTNDDTKIESIVGANEVIAHGGVVKIINKTNEPADSGLGPTVQLKKFPRLTDESE